MTIAKVRTRGQVTIPRNIREACGITSGATLTYILTGRGQFACRALPERRSLRDLIEQYSVDGVAPDVETLIKEAEVEEAERYLDEIGVDWRSNQAGSMRDPFGPFDKGAP
jgi:bifunctional DNA-binding transcriptional regulator/antitoxin component of YhaV-PrlF toxin-antitoxin module